jgi:hypothetical protein
MHTEVWSEHLKRRDHLEDLDVDDRIILYVTTDRFWIDDWIY